MKLVAPPSEQIGVQILDTNVTSVTPTEIEEIKQLVYDYKLVIFREQNINDSQYIEFAKKIGTPQVYPQDNYHHPEHPEIFVSSNVPKDGKKFGVRGTGRYWHTDCAFLDEPLPFTMLYPKILPKSIRETYYIDMQQVYKKLPAHLKSYVDGKYLIHEGKWRYKVQEWDIDKAIIDILRDIEERFPAVRHPAVVTHPVTGAKILYASSGFTTGIEGLEYETNQKVLPELFAFIEREEHIHTHVWQDGDLILWENRTLNHMASTVLPGEKSVSYRIGVYDGLPFYVSSEKVAEKSLLAR
ncbi:MAG: TauD/TfdA family dioxygenase [Xenococcaceae cyanobacterium MO_188.B29]|nr:TauD/TfdA family dioxygenase [Xenococcaceae cyanobacterium MO_188.B29]